MYKLKDIILLFFLNCVQKGQNAKKNKKKIKKEH